MARRNLVEVGTLRPALADHIRADFPDMPDHALISLKELARYRTPIENLYLCGAATHPGGGVMGASGRLAAAAHQQDGA